MIVMLQKGKLSLRDSEDFSRFSLLCLDDIRPGVGRGPGGIEVTPEGHAWVPISTVVELREPRPSKTWRLGFDEMIEKERGFGWIDEEGRRIRAHIADSASQG